MQQPRAPAAQGADSTGRVKYWVEQWSEFLDASGTGREEGPVLESMERYKSLLVAVQEKRRLQMLDAGTETFMDEKERAQLAARRVGLNVPEGLDIEQEKGSLEVTERQISSVIQQQVAKSIVKSHERRHGKPGT